MKPSIPKGTRDFTPDMVRKRNYIFDSIRAVFVKYGYQPIETPTMETLSTLTGKYGEEGDKLLFKVLNNGDFLAKANEEALTAKDSNQLIPSIAKRGLRYDLTVPFARFVVMNQNDIPLPFKRYQIQPVWRADRPQKGRYQEFYQCDVDVVGSNSLMYEAELVQIYDEVFAQLKLPVSIRYNNRKILFGMAEAAGIADQFMDMTVAIDKLDKVGMEGVAKEMLGRGIPQTAVDQIQQQLEDGSLESLKSFLSTSETGQKGIEELESLQSFLSTGKLQNEVLFDCTLARGLSYYTGCIFEVQGIGVQMGSLGGGGRYDDLTGIFGLKNVSGVGVSFGAERIYDVMEELNLFPPDTQDALRIILIAFDKESHLYAFRCLNQIREAGIAAELYPDPVKLKKQMKYANARKAPFVAFAGAEEMGQGVLTLKNMETGEQDSVKLEQLISRLHS
jgi:histidyl-tRNA synthetase